MAFRKGTLKVKERILSVSVRLFLQKGYRATTISQIVKEARVSVSSLQNIFHAKEDILGDLVEVVFCRQFEEAAGICGEDLPPMYAYAVAASVQLALTEQNENMRELYLEAYSVPNTSEYIYQHTAEELLRSFGRYMPDFTLGNFYNMEIGTAGVMRGYMSRRCSLHFTIKDKVECFLTTVMRTYRVPEEEQRKVLDYVGHLDLSAAADGVLRNLIAALEAQYGFTLQP